MSHSPSSEYCLSRDLAEKESRRTTTAPIISTDISSPEETTDTPTPLDEIQALRDEVAELRAEVSNLTSMLAPKAMESSAVTPTFPATHSSLKPVLHPQQARIAFWNNPLAQRLANIFAAEGVRIKGDTDHVRSDMRNAAVHRNGLASNVRLECHDAILAVDETSANATAAVVARIGGTLDSPTLRAVSRVCHAKIVKDSRNVHIDTLVAATKTVMDEIPHARTSDKMYRRIRDVYASKIAEQF